MTGQPHMGSGPLLATINLAKDLRAMRIPMRACNTICIYIYNVNTIILYIMLIHWGYIICTTCVNICTVSSDSETIVSKTKSCLHTV